MPDSPRPIWPSGTLLIAAVLLVLLLPLQARVIVGGRSLIQTNYSNPFDWRPTEANYGPRFTPHDEWTRRNLWPFANIRDPGAAWWQWEPGLRFLQEALRRREWPLWNPYIGGGTPAMANLVPAYFFPPFALLAALGAAPWLQNAYFLLLLYGAALLTALLLRQHDLGLWPSLTGGAIVLTCGALNQNMGSFLEQTLACLPVTLYATRVLLDRPSARRAGALAAIYAATALSSFPPLLFGVFGLTALYACVLLGSGDCCRGARGVPAAAGWWVAGTALSLGLVAALYAPALALGRDAPQVTQLYAEGGLETLPVTRLLQVFSPTLYGGVQVYLAGVFAATGQDPHLPYTGAACVGLALLASSGAGRRRRSLLVAAAGGGALIVLKLVGVPPVQWIARLPGFNQLHYAYYLGLPLAIVLAVLAAFGLDALLAGRTSRWRAGLAAAVLVGCLGLLWHLAAADPRFGGPEGADWLRDWRVLAAATLATLGILAANTWWRPVRRAWLAPALIIAVILGEGLYNTRFPKPMRWDVFGPPLPYVAAAMTQAGRNHVFPESIPPPDASQAYDLRSLGSLMPYNPPRIWALYHDVTGAPGEVFMRAPAKLPPDPFLDRAGVTAVGTYAHTPFAAEAGRRGYTRVFDDGFSQVYGRSGPPRVRFASDFRIVSPDEARALVPTLTDPVVLLEEAPGVPAAPDRPDDPGVTVFEELNRVRVQLTAPRPGLVYLADSYMTGWTARVNGTPAPILAANYAFRAVAVPAGAVDVEFRYWPPWLTGGLAISGVSLLVLGGLLVAGRR